MPAEIPKISVVPDGANFRLMATSYGTTATAGARLFRAPPHPDIQFYNTNQLEAKQDCATLQKYLDETWPQKAPSKTKLRRDRD